MTAQATAVEPATRNAPVSAVAVYEVADSSRRRAQQLVQSLGYRLAVEPDLEGLQRRAASGDPVRILLAALPEGKDLVSALRDSEAPPVVIASLAGPPATGRQRFAEFQDQLAQLYAVRPHSVESLGPVLHAAHALLAQKDELVGLRGVEHRLRTQLHEAGHSGNVTGFHHFEYFKRLLVLEIKRAKRFGYSIAVCLVAPDEWQEPAPPVEIQRKLRQKAARSIVANIRDIDIPVDYADDRMLLFLPYTDLDGAREVGERVTKAVARSAHTRDGDRTINLTVSCGISALRSGKPISFARLMKDATAALKAAQLKGGRRVIVRA